MNGSRSYALRLRLLPWLLGALVLRALIPPGFMPASGGELSVAMCSTRGMPTESLEIPVHGADLHCDYCLTPASATPPTHPASPLARLAQEQVPQQYPVAAHGLAVLRSQTARAPPA